METITQVATSKTLCHSGTEADLRLDVVAKKIIEVGAIEMDSHRHS